MKKVFLYVVMTCLFLSGNVFSQENKSGFVTTLSAQYGLEKRAAFELGYQASDAYFYLESSIGRLDNEYDVYHVPSVRMGFDYSFLTTDYISLLGGLFAGYSRYSYQGRNEERTHRYSKTDALVLGARLGVKLHLGSSFFIRAMGVVSNADFEREFYYSRHDHHRPDGIKHIWDSGILVGIGVSF